jgi:AbrB family looped-hinge helix DNA binding protein
VIAKISTKGQMVIPEAIRKQAHLRAGDEVEVGIADGLVVLRKRVPLTPARVRSLLRGTSDLPEITEADEAAVAQAVQRVRRRREA